MSLYEVNRTTAISLIPSICQSLCTGDKNCLMVEYSDNYFYLGIYVCIFWEYCEPYANTDSTLYVHNLGIYIYICVCYLFVIFLFVYFKFCLLLNRNTSTNML